MKKYKVITDNLTWLDIMPKWDILFTDDKKITIYNRRGDKIKTITDDMELYEIITNAVVKRPDWFNMYVVIPTPPKVTRKVFLSDELQKEYTKEDMVEFAKFIHSSNIIYEANRREIIPIDVSLVDIWFKTRKV